MIELRGKYYRAQLRGERGEGDDGGEEETEERGSGRWEILGRGERIGELSREC